MTKQQGPQVPDDVAARVRAAVAGLTTARLEFSRAFQAFLQAAPEIPAAEFWRIAGIYRGLLAARLRRTDSSAPRAVPSAARELARLAWQGEGGFVGNSLVALAGFVREYTAVERRMGAWFDAHIDEVDLERSDDSYSDLLDALPVAGEAVYSRIIGGTITTNAQLGQAVRGAVGSVAVAGLILDGESYHRTTLERGLRTFLEISIRSDLASARTVADAADLIDTGGLDE